MNFSKFEIRTDNLFEFGRDEGNISENFRKKTGKFLGINKEILVNIFEKFPNQFRKFEFFSKTPPKGKLKNDIRKLSKMFHFIHSEIFEPFFEKRPIPLSEIRKLFPKTLALRLPSLLASPPLCSA